LLLLRRKQRRQKKTVLPREINLSARFSGSRGGTMPTTATAAGLPRLYRVDLTPVSNSAGASCANLKLDLRVELPTLQNFNLSLMLPLQSGGNLNLSKLHGGVEFYVAY
jgi:hypothetical protein